jgi:RNA polymerase sigma factor (sigma-70 family)
MTILIEPTMIITGLMDRTEPAVSHFRQRPPTIHSAVPSPRSHPAAVPSVPTEDLLCQRNHLPLAHPDRAKLRARAMEQNPPMAGRLARRYPGKGERQDDLAQVAAVALINAVDRFDPRRQVPFAGFAIPSIRGALKRHYRDTAWAMRVPRSVQQLALRVPAAAVGARQNYRLASLNTPHPDRGRTLPTSSVASMRATRASTTTCRFSRSWRNCPYGNGGSSPYGSTST